ncbi:hypothetical protein KDL45_01095 [bacterium]|nr:hypothetical protein [bacterium]
MRMRAAVFAMLFVIATVGACAEGGSPRGGGFNGPDSEPDDEKAAPDDKAFAAGDDDVPDGYDCYVYESTAIDQADGHVLISDTPRLLVKEHPSGVLTGAYGVIGEPLSTVIGYKGSIATILFADKSDVAAFETHVIETLATNFVDIASHDQEGAILADPDHEIYHFAPGGPFDCSGMEIDPDYDCEGIWCADNPWHWLAAVVDRMVDREPSVPAATVCLDGEFSGNHRLAFDIDQSGRIQGMEYMGYTAAPVGGFALDDKYIVFTDYADGRTPGHEAGMYLIDDFDLTGKRFRVTDLGQVDRPEGKDVSFLPCAE